MKQVKVLFNTYKYFVNYVGYFFGFLTAIVLINTQNESVYSNLILAGLFSSSMISIFSFKPFYRSIYDAETDLVEITIKELCLKFVGFFIYLILIWNLLEDYHTFYIAYGIITALKAIEQSFDSWSTLSDVNHNKYTLYTFISKAFSFGISITMLLLFGVTYYISALVVLSLVDLTFKLFIIRDQLFPIFRLDRLLHGNKFEKVAFFKDPFVYQNIFGVFNKQYDTFFIFFFIEDKGAIALYIFFKQMSSIYSNSSSALSRMIKRSDYNYGTVKYLIISSCLLIPWFMPTMSGYKIDNQLLLIFGLIWVGIILSIDTSYRMVSQRLINTQTYISCANSLAIALLFFVFDSVGVFDLIYIRTVAVYLPLILQTIALRRLNNV